MWLEMCVAVAKLERWWLRTTLDPDWEGRKEECEAGEEDVAA